MKFIMAEASFGEEHNSTFGPIFGGQVNMVNASLILLIIIWIPFPLCADNKAYDKNWNLKYRIQDNKVYDKNWRKEYNTIRPHGSLGYKPPAPEIIVPYLQNPLAEAQKTGGSLTLKVVQ